MNNNTFSIEKKACTKCGNILPNTADYFNRGSHTKTGFITICKQCKLEQRLLTQDQAKERSKRYAEKNKEKLKKYYKEYAEQNSERLKEYYKAYHEENREKRTKQSKERYYREFDKIAEYHKNRNKDPEFIKQRREYRKTRRERDRELGNEWRRNNKEKVSTIKQRRYNKKKNLDSDLTHEQWLKIIKDFDNKCAYCGKEKKLTREHFIPLTKNGEFTKNNIIPACRGCNSSKNNRNFFDWYPTFEHYSKQREKKILSYLGYKNKVQQLSIL